MSAMPEIELHPLPPFLPEGARLLMLGSFPPPRERWCMEFFYPNPQNDMWRIMGQVFFGDKTHFELQSDKTHFELYRDKTHWEGQRDKTSLELPRDGILRDRQHSPKNRKTVFDCEAIVAFCREQGIAIFDTA